jgi:peptidoglycan hydrolase-like protein with peptidoglycan-binding domain
MRRAGAVVIVSALSAAAVIVGASLPDSTKALAQAQSAGTGIRLAEAQKKAPAKKAAAKKKGAAAAGPVPPGYSSMPLAERVGIQFDLAWANYYNGLINGEFNDRAVAAVRAFQKDNRFRESGVLAPPERAALAARSKLKQEQVGWTMVEDKVTGAQIGLPTRQVPTSSPSRSGTRWASAQGQIQVETFRIREPGVTLSSVFEQQKKEPANRRLEVNLLRDDFFILNGMQGLKKFYVRAEVRDLEIRGFTLLYDQATEGIMDPVAVVMSSAFAPFPGSGLTTLIGPAPRRKVEYGTGLVVSAGGHILTDQKLTDGCEVVQVSGHGDANRLVDDSAAGLTLLRIFGAAELKPLALVHEGARAGDLTLVGIADPQAQGGGRAASTATARIAGDGLAPAPQLGFAGAAALDSQGRFFGMVTLKTSVLASAGSTTVPLPQAAIVSVETIRRFLDTQYVTAATGPAGADAVKAALVRVICVRR